MLEGIPFGDFYFETAILLKKNLLVSSMLCNSEAGGNLSIAELDLLETIDVKFLRSILKAPTSNGKTDLLSTNGP